jgi:tRNA U34 5-methylaminomethyl-2-thiouridine-forming methyltransferase MnmC
MEGDLKDYTLKASSIDLIYFDAFAPKIQPNLWTLAVMQKMHHALRPGGVFITYCAQGQLKRNLKAAGFQVEALPGPPGKREITRAIKKKLTTFKLKYKATKHE